MLNGKRVVKKVSKGDMGEASLPGKCAPAAKQPGAPGVCPSLDTHTPELAHLRKPFRTASDRRLFSRTLLGLLIPGRYYFLTLTSAPGSPKLEDSWNSLRQWLKRYRPGIVWIYCFTAEGNGVIHMIVRLGMRQKRILHKDLSAAWFRIHGARIVWIRRVKESDKKNLANYISDQRKLRSMGSEMAWQPGVVRWRWSAGWIPKGFVCQFGKFWRDFTFDNCPPDWFRDAWLRGWIQKCHLDVSNVEKRPRFKEL